MIACVVLDDENGMVFNNRRQSQDRVLRENLLEESNSKRLWMNSYSVKQFGELLPDNIMVDEDFLFKAGENDYCFIENVSLAAYESSIKKLIVYKWNKLYPADIYFDVDLQNGSWEMESRFEFKGYSHDLITKEIWIKNE